MAKKGKTQTYYDKNPDADRRRQEQQKLYNEGKGNGKRTGREITIAANKLRAKLKLPVGDPRDASHYKGSKTKGRPLSKKKNRSRKA